MPDSGGDVTRLLGQLRSGQQDAANQIIPLIYDELRRIAGALMRRERPGHTMQATEVVNEAYMRLVGGQDVEWQNRAHFFAFAARTMRQVLLDYARALGCDADDATPRFVLRDDERQAAQQLLRVHDVAGAYHVLHPTRGQSAQRARWPVDGFIALARTLVARDGVPVLVTGSAEDAPIAEAIADGAGRGVIAVAGATTIGVFAAVAERARAVVAMDSGPMHVAAAVGAPTVGIFALQSDEPDRWAPLGARVASVRPSYPCPPGHRKETCPDFACVRELDEARVLAALDGLLLTAAER